MVSITRLLARQFRAVCRRCLRKLYGGSCARLECQAGPEGLRLRLAHTEFAIEYLHAGDYPVATVSLPLAALADFEGGSQDVVSLEVSGDNKVLARWQDAGVPQAVEYDIPSPAGQTEFPGPAERWVSNPPRLLQALDEAAQSAATESVRFALQRVQFRGRSGEVVATDGRQLLVQRDFTFPWTDDLLVTSLRVFGSKELSAAKAVDVGRTEHYLVLRVGPWTFYLKIDVGARYPDCRQVIPRRTPASTLWRIAPEDAVFLARTLPRLPGQDDDQQPLTVALDRQVSIRARASEASRTTEIVLTRSEYTGKPITFCVNRRLLVRLLQLGFAEVRVSAADTPLVAQDAQRTLVMMPLGKEGVLGPSEDSLRLVSDEGLPILKSPLSERRSETVSTPQPNGSGNGHPGKPRKSVTPLEDHGSVAEPSASHGGKGFGTLIAEAQTLKEILRDAYGRSSRLVAALKRQRQQTRLVASTLASLRQLQHLDG